MAMTVSTRDLLRVSTGLIMRPTPLNGGNRGALGPWINQDFVKKKQWFNQ